MMLTGVLPQERLARGAWGEIISCCTKMDPQERYNSIDQVIAAIDHIQSRSKDAERGIKCRYAPPGFRTLNPLTNNQRSGVRVTPPAPRLLIER